AADMKNTGAYFYLGVMYRHGQGVVKNLDKAYDYLGDMIYEDDVLEYLNKTAQKGISDAYIALVLFYGLQLFRAEDGQEGLKYFQKILQYAQKAADMGDSLGYTDLGMLYYKGVSFMEFFDKKPDSPHVQQEVQKLSSFQPNYQKALEYFQKAAKMGDPMAYAMLAQMYGNGDGVGKDEEMAKQYAQKACDAGAKDFCP
ncbi:tetratricopeptide repeat protein, partial [Helicobacter heilmannii]|uniref:tetratricopeptide repeat protein n=1 Tax=Helicobacter heilmannii TaxID=35817 RepID=UPI000A8BCD21